MSKYRELRNDFEDDGFIFIDGWFDNDENSQGTVVAKVSIESKEVIFVDESAKDYDNVKEIISETLKQLS